MEKQTSNNLQMMHFFIYWHLKKITRNIWGPERGK